MEGAVRTSIGGAKAFVASTLAGLCVLTTGTAVIAKYTPLLTHLGVPSGYVVGHHIDLPPVMYDQANGTLVVFERSGCSACKDSLPYLRRLLADLQLSVSLLRAVRP